MNSISQRFLVGKYTILLVAFFQLLSVGSIGAKVMEEWGEGLGQYPHSVFSFLYEVSFLKIDVAVIELRLDARTAQRTAEITQASEANDSTRGQVGEILLAAETIAFSMDLQRDASCDRLLKGMLANLKRAFKNGLISEADHTLVSTVLPALFAPHDARGVFAGERLMYRVQPDGVRVFFVANDGEVLVDSFEPGLGWVNGIKGIFLGQDSKLRQRVVEATWGPD